MNIFLIYLFIYVSHGPKETLPTLKLQSHNKLKIIFLCFMNLHCHFLANQNLPFCQEKNHLQSLLQPAPKRVRHLGNPYLGTFREHDGNIMGTHWEQGKKNKKSLALPWPPSLKKKKKMDHSHSLHEISLSKNVHHQFFAWATLMPILKNLGVLIFSGNFQPF
jgi:hypothetical protein